MTEQGQHGGCCSGSGGCGCSSSGCKKFVIIAAVIVAVIALIKWLV